jgi:hypothetical protein
MSTRPAHTTQPRRPISTRSGRSERIAARRTATSTRQLNPVPSAGARSHLFEPRLARCILSSYAILWAGTILFALVALPLAGHLREVFGYRLLPARAGTAGMAALIAANNFREASIPLLFAVLKIRGRRWLVIVGDVVVGAALTVNVARAGLVIGSYGVGLLHFLPQWPLEWGGLAIALAAWRRARSGRRDPLELTLLAIATLTLLCGAALLETYAVPQS